MFSSAGDPCINGAMQSTLLSIFCSLSVECVHSSESSTDYLYCCGIFHIMNGLGHIFWKDFNDFTFHISLLIHSGLILYIVKDRNPFICLLTWLISCAGSLLKDPYFPTGWKHQFYHVLNMRRYLSICPIVFHGCFQTFPYLLVYDTVLKHGLYPGKESPWHLLHMRPELFS